MNPLLEKLTGGDRRSVGRVDEVIAQVLADPHLFGPLIDGMSAADPLIRMRSADAIEKITLRHPEWLAPYKERLLHEISQVEQQEVRWHLAQLFARLPLATEERRTVMQILEGYLKDESKIVKTFVMQTLADIEMQDRDLRPQIVSRLEQLTATGSPAMRSRGRKLLAKLT